MIHTKFHDFDLDPLKFERVPFVAKTIDLFFFVREKILAPYNLLVFHF